VSFSPCVVTSYVMSVTQVLCHLLLVTYITYIHQLTASRMMKNKLLYKRWIGGECAAFVQLDQKDVLFVWFIYSPSKYSDSLPRLISASAWGDGDVISLLTITRTMCRSDRVRQFRLLQHITSLYDRTSVVNDKLLYCANGR
jgi:hypothetical protein